MLFLLLIDPSLGRLDYASLSQQALMERLTDGISNREAICGSQNEPKDISEWIAVGLNKAGEVIDIEWPFLNFTGVLHLEWLPSTLKNIAVAGNKNLSGPMNLTLLPADLERMCLSNNKFNGEIDLDHLPGKLEILNIWDNELSGSVNLRNLPSSLCFLNLDHNSLSGTVDLTQLPDKMDYLGLGENGFMGTVNLTSLPTQMITLYLEENDFSGETDFSKLPDSLERLNLTNTKLSGKISWKRGKAFIVKNTNVTLQMNS